MKKIILFCIFMMLTLVHAKEVTPWAAALKNLTPQERHVIVDKGTEMPFTGKYTTHDEKGVYKCKVCGEKLYNSTDKFNSGSIMLLL